MNHKIIFLLLFHIGAYGLDYDFLQVYFYLSPSKGSGHGLLLNLLREIKSDYSDNDLRLVTADIIVSYNILTDDIKHELYDQINDTTLLDGIFVYEILNTGCYLLTRYNEENQDKKNIEKDFTEYGYRYEKIKFISDLRIFYNKQKESFEPINGENFSVKKLFSVLNKSNVKRVFCLRGHSSFDSDNFLGMPLEYFIEAMTELTQLEPMFILIASCYSSGERSLILGHSDCYKNKKRPNFPIFTIGLNDHTIAERPYFHFCCHLIKYLKNKINLSLLCDNKDIKKEVYIKALFPEDSEPKLLQLPEGYIHLDFFNEKICITQNQKIKVFISSVGATKSLINNMLCLKFKKANFLKIIPTNICNGKKSPSFIFIKEIICADGKINNIGFLSFSKSNIINFVYQDDDKKKYFGFFYQYKPIIYSCGNKIINQTEFINLINEMISICEPSDIIKKYDYDYEQKNSLVLKEVSQALSY